MKINTALPRAIACERFEKAAVRLSGQNLWTRFDSVALNPQPLPPKDSSTGLARCYETVALNPQPLPPKEIAPGPPDPIGPIALNPQPLPPRFAPVSLTMRLAVLR